MCKNYPTNFLKKKVIKGGGDVLTVISVTINTLRFWLKIDKEFNGIEQFQKSE